MFNKIESPEERVITSTKHEVKYEAANLNPSRYIRRADVEHHELTLKKAIKTLINKLGNVLQNTGNIL